jgi:hypothetical protein
MWLAGGFLNAWLALENSHTVDRLLRQADPAVTLRIRMLGTADTALLLRYEAAEQTRRSSELWEIAQLALGAFVFFFLLFATSEGKGALALALLMLAGVLLQRFYLTPELTSTGRVVDFIPDNVYSSFRSRYVVLEGAYAGVEIGKWLMGGWLTAILILRGRHGPSRNAWNQFDLVDKADHSHINR